MFRVVVCLVVICGNGRVCGPEAGRPPARSAPTAACPGAAERFAGRLHGQGPREVGAGAAAERTRAVPSRPPIARWRRRCSAFRRSQRRPIIATSPLGTCGSASSIRPTSISAPPSRSIPRTPHRGMGWPASGATGDFPTWRSPMRIAPSITLQTHRLCITRWARCCRRSVNGPPRERSSNRRSRSTSPRPTR